MVYIELLNFYVNNISANIIQEYLGPYCYLCGKTFVDKFLVYTVHENEYEYYECIDDKKCIKTQVKSKNNPWNTTQGS